VRGTFFGSLAKGDSWVSFGERENEEERRRIVFPSPPASNAALQEATYL